MTSPNQDGDFYFVTDRRLQAMARDLSELENLFCDLYGTEQWAKAVSATPQSHG
jgi:hypothetical protein